MLHKKPGINTVTLISACVISCFAFASTSYAVDSTSVEFATGNKTKMVRIGAQWEMENRWFQSNDNHLGAYWDLTAAQWREEQFQGVRGRSENITDIGITPVFRFQSDSKTGLYGEIGIGAHLLSGLYDNNGRKLSTNFQFGDHLGVGYVFNKNFDIGVKFQHFSNGGFKQPNNGVNFGLVRASYKF